MKRKTIIVCMAIAITIALPLITFSAIYISDKAKMKKINDAICDCYVAAESNHQELLCSSLYRLTEKKNPILFYKEETSALYAKCFIDITNSDMLAKLALSQDYRLVLDNGQFKDYSKQDFASLNVLSWAEEYHKGKYKLFYVYNRNVSSIFRHLYNISCDCVNLFSDEFHETVFLIGLHNWSCTNYIDLGKDGIRNNFSSKLTKIQSLLVECPQTHILYVLLCRYYLWLNEYQKVIDYGLRSFECEEVNKADALDVIWMMHYSYLQLGNKGAAKEMEDAVAAVYNKNIKDVEYSVIQTCK